MQTPDHWQDCPLEWPIDPAGVYSPNDDQEVRSLISHLSSSSISFRIVSRGMNLGYGAHSAERSDQVIVSLHKMNKITEFDPELGVVIVEPGVTKIQLLKFLQETEYTWFGWGGPDSSSVVGHLLERGISYLGHQLTCVTGVAGFDLVGNSIREGCFRLPNSRAMKLGAILPGIDGLAMVFQNPSFVVTKVALKLPKKRNTHTLYIDCESTGHLHKLLDLYRDQFFGQSHFLSRIHCREKWASLLRVSVQMSHQELGVSIEQKQIEFALNREFKSAWTGILVSEFSLESDPMVARLTAEPGFSVQSLRGLGDRVRNQILPIEALPERKLPFELFIEEAGIESTFKVFGEQLTGLRFLNAWVPNFQKDRETFLSIVSKILGNQPYVAEFCPINRELLIGLITLHHELGNHEKIKAAEELAVHLLTTLIQNGMPPYRLDVSSKKALDKICLF